MVIGGERRAERAAGIARGRLDPDVLELAVAQHLAVGDAIERHAAGEAEILGAGLAGERARQAQHDLLGHRLDRGGEIHVALGQQLVGLARRRAEQRVELVVGHASGRCNSRSIDWSSRNEPSALRSIRLSRISLRVFRLAVGREPHHLVLAGIDLEAGVVGEGGIEQPERMREVDLLERSSRSLPRPTPTDVVAHSPTPSIVSTAASSNGEGKNARGGVAQVMLGEQQLALPVEVARELPAARRAAAASGTASPQPQRHRHAERAKAARREGEIGFEQPLEFQKRLVVEHDVIDVVQRDARLPPGNRRARDAGKPASCFLRVKRSSCAAATMRPSSTRAAALS